MIANDPIASVGIADSGGVDAALSGAALVMPFMTLSASDRLQGARIVLPMELLKAGWGGFASLEMPMEWMVSTGGPGKNVTNLTLPMEMLSAFSGVTAQLVLPMQTLSASATSIGWGNTALTLPMEMLSASGATGALLGANLTLPMEMLAAQSGGNAALTLPMFTLSTDASGGATAKAALRLPMEVLAAGATAHNFGSASLVLPMEILTGTPHGAKLVMPFMSLTAVGGAEVDVLFEAFALNLKHTGLGPREAPVDEVTHYTNFPFHKIVRFNGKHYGLGPEGVYEIGGETDDGDPIEWSYRTGTTDFGSPMKKTPVSVYITGRVPADISFKLLAGEKTENVYDYTNPRGATAQVYRQTFGRGLDDKYYALEIGGDKTINIATVEYNINGLTRRI